MIKFKKNKKVTNKKSAESDVVPAGIVIQVPICIEKNLFCSIQETDGLVCKKK